MKAKVANSVIVGMVLISTIFLGTLAEIGKGSEVMPTLFLCFFAIILAIQVVPALMLFGVLLREIFRRLPRGEREGRSINR
jgi:hypothetical protein